MGQVVESIGLADDIEGKCRICSGRISEKYMTRIDVRIFHESCTRCCICSVQLLEKCYEKGGQLFCSTHYFKDYSPYRCSGCKCGISPNDKVYKLKTGMVFHENCHFCSRCGIPLSSGEPILVDEVGQTMTCMRHFYSDLNQQRAASFPIYPNVVSGIGIDQLSEIRIKKEVDAFGYNFESFTFSEFYDDDSKFLKRRGPRTTIKQNQLDVLNRIFSSTPKPSKHARAKLALETGLSMRVIQVWFQNRRSKERRLKHLCNYLRHYEQCGYFPPPIHFTAETGISSDVTSFSHYLSATDGQFDEDEEED